MPSSTGSGSAGRFAGSGIDDETDGVDLASAEMEAARLQSGEKWVSIKTLSAILERSYPATLKMIKAGHVRAVRIGGRWRIYESEVLRLLRKGNFPQ